MKKNRVANFVTVTCIAVLGVTGMLADHAFGADIIETLEATCELGSVKSVTAKQVVIVIDGKEKVFPTQDVASITLGQAQDTMKEKGRHVVTTVSGHVFVASSRSLITEGEDLKFTNSLLGEVTLGFGRISDVFMPKPQITPESVRNRCQRLELLSKSFDMLVIQRNDGNWIGAEGTFHGITENEIVFIVDDQQRKKARSSCPAIRLSSLTKPTATVGEIVSSNGTIVKFTSLTLEGKQITIEAPGLGLRTVDREKVAMIQMTSGRVVNLAEIEPAAVKEYGYFDETFNFRKNLSVSGKPIKLGGKIYPLGLGMHSFSEITWNIDGKFVKFVSLVGIDDSVKPLGDASVVFLCDGKVVKTIRVEGKKAATNVIVDVKDVKKLTVRVGFGEDGLGVSDHVDLAGARFIK